MVRSGGRRHGDNSNPELHRKRAMTMRCRRELAGVHNSQDSRIPSAPQGTSGSGAGSVSRCQTGAVACPVANCEISRLLSDDRGHFVASTGRDAVPDGVAGDHADQTGAGLIGDRVGDQQKCDAYQGDKSDHGFRRVCDVHLCPIHKQTRTIKLITKASAAVFASSLVTIMGPAGTGGRL